MKPSNICAQKYVTLDYFLTNYRKKYMMRKQQYLFGCVFLSMIWALAMLNSSLEINESTEDTVESEFEEIYYERDEYFKIYNLQQVP